MMRNLDKQVGGDHYKEFAIQPIEFIVGNKLDFPTGNIIKYVTRFSKLKDTRDLEKAIHYIEFLMDEEEEKPKEDKYRFCLMEKTKDTESWKYCKYVPGKTVVKW